jgi:D-proline reductase (dithiol) PrdB
VGLIQRIIEAEGIATISVSLSKDITCKIKPPRAIYTGFPLGHPLSFPGQSFRQLQILRVLLKCLREIKLPGTLLELDLTEDQDPTVTCVVCEI